MKVVSVTQPARLNPWLMPLIASVAIVLAWIPTLVFFIVIFPRFVPIFERMEKMPRGLPMLTAAIMPLARLGPSLSSLIVASFVMVLAGSTVAYVRLRRPGGLVIPTFFAAAGFVSFLICLAAVLGPSTHMID